MGSGASATSATRLTWWPSPGTWSAWWRGAWSRSAAIRAARAAVVMPAVFALADQVIGNLQLATYAAFGSFATLVLVGFVGTRRQKLIAHAELALIGALLVVIGTAVTSSAALAVVVTVPVTFCVFFAGLAGPNASSGVFGALLAYVLPAASPGAVSMIPDRVAGWLLASVIGALAVLLVPTPEPGGRVRVALSKLGSLLADQIDLLLKRGRDDEHLTACVDAKGELLVQYNLTPFRPTGLATSDQAMANAVQQLEWCTALVLDTAHAQADLSQALASTRELMDVTAVVLRQAGALFTGPGARPDCARLAESRKRDLAELKRLDPDRADFGAQAELSFHGQVIAVATLAFAADTTVAAGLEGADWLADVRARWFGGATLGLGDQQVQSGLSRYTAIARRHASPRSTWFINSARGALSLAAAVAVADLSGVQHGFWVVLATLSVLRTSAASTGSTALRALLGTAVGFAVGGALLVAVGTGSSALWAALPVAVLLAGYAPGTLSFALGQAAFTVTVAVLFNLLAPVGWRVGVVRIQDVAIGSGVSVIVGALFWPRGMASVVADDIADAYRSGAAYLSHAVGWVCGLRRDAPAEAMAVVSAGLRLDAALRAFIAERGTKHLSPQELWRLVGGAMRLRLTAHAISGLPPRTEPPGATGRALDHRSRVLAGFYEQLAAQLDRSGNRPVAAPVPPRFADADVERWDVSARAVWLREHLEHLREHVPELVEPATQVAELRRQPWWR